jgi:hypothetical protein
MKKKPTLTKQRSEPSGSNRGQTLRALLDKKLPLAVPRIWPWLDSGESCLLWGGTGTGKSMIAMTLALGVAGGGEVLGWKFSHPCRVYYIDGEQSARDLQSRFAVLSGTIDEHNMETAKDNLVVLSRTESTPGSTFFDLNAVDQVPPFISTLKEEGVGFVVFDNLSTLSDSLTDENKAAEFKRMQALFSQLKAANIAAFLVHHAGKSAGARYRGSSNIETTFERTLGLSHNDKEPPTVLAVRAQIEKYRAKPPPGFVPQLHFRLATTEDAKGRVQTTRWQIDHEQGQLAEGWRMFHTGDYDTVGEFVAAFNARFGTKNRVGNFAREFSRLWQRELGIDGAEIERVKRWIRSAEREDPSPEGEDAF